MYPTKTYYSEYDWVTNEWLYSIGIKYYLPFGSEAIRPYVDVMYGGISVEAVQIVKEFSWLCDGELPAVQVGNSRDGVPGMPVL